MSLAPEHRIIGETEALIEMSDAERAVPPDARVSPVAIRVELAGTRAMLGFQAAWSDLAARALEPNVFLDPAFALPLLQHVRFEIRPQFLLAWEDDGPPSAGRLVGLLPLHVPKGRRRPVRGFHHEQVTLGTPLIDSLRGAEVLGAMLSWVDANHIAPALLLTEIPADGVFCDLLREQSARQGRAVVMIDKRERAVLTHCALDNAPGVVTLQSAKRRKERRRQRRRLGDAGLVTYHSARTPTAIQRAAERFMALEASGWKGRRGSALLVNPTLATFTRTMTRLMAYDARCRIDSLEVDGIPVAMGILVMAGTQAYFWKTTYSEHFASLSPGVQFVLELTDVQRNERGLTLTDSCAVPNHPMIDRIWSDRMAVTDLLIELRPTGTATGGARSFRHAVRGAILRRRFRAFAKKMMRIAMRWGGRTH